MFVDERGSPIAPQCSDKALRGFYCELSDADVVYMKSKVGLACDDLRCPHWRWCVYAMGKE